MACQQASPELAIHIVCASRVSRSDFTQDTLLGRCLQRPEHRDYNTAICFGNSDPLAITYNAAIEAAPPGSVLVFCHDDLDLGPGPLGPQLQAALARADRLVAGSSSWRLIHTIRGQGYCLSERLPQLEARE